MRLFVGIPLAAAVIDELSAISQRLQRDGDGLRWTAPESWHITLQFLGAAGPEQCECTAARLHGVQLPPVVIKLEGMGFFDRAGVFFAGVEVSPELLLLQERVSKATALCGFIAEARPYQPHITLARSKGSGHGLVELHAQLHRQPEFNRFVAEEFLLYESFLGASGARYEIRDRFALDGR
jgi:2'-5' RNA ligase